MAFLAPTEDMGRGFVAPEGEANTFIAPESDLSQDDPGLGSIGAGIGTEVIIGEGGKLGGAAIGTVIAPGVGTAIGYAIGAIASGATGSLAAQRIEGRDNISWGRVVADSLINLIPGSKAAKGAGFAARVGSSALRQGAAGAAIAPAAQSVEIGIEEDRLPTFEEFSQMALVGGALGAGLGISSEAATNLYRKFAGTTPANLQKAILEGDPDAVKLVDVVTEASGPTERSAKNRISELWEHALVKIAPSKIAGREIFDLTKQAKDTVLANRAIGSILREDINQAIARTSNPAQAQEEVSAYLLKETNDFPSEIAELKEKVDFGREQIEEWQDILLKNHDNGTRPLPEYLVNEIRRSRESGDYLTREYRFFEDPNYKPPSQNREAVIQEFIRGGRTKADAEKYLGELQSRRSNAEDVRGYLFGSTPKGILKQKNNDLSPTIRRYLGEITEPGERLEGTISRMARLAAYDRSDASIVEAMKRMGIVRRPGQGTEGYELFRGRSGIVRDAEGDIYIPSAMQDAIRTIYSSGVADNSRDLAEGTLRDMFGSSIALSKAVKVLLNPPSYGVQFFGNLASVLGMGMNPYIGSGLGVRHGASQFSRYARGLAPEDLATYKRAIELDLVQPGVSISDIRAGLQGGKIGRSVGAMLDPFGKAYSIPDIMFRVSAWDNYRSMLRRHFPALNEKRFVNQLDEEAASLTNATYQNYNFLSPALRTLSKYGVLGQFAAFSLELMRNQYNQANLIRRMLNGDYARAITRKYGSEVNHSAIRKDALKKLAALSSVYGAATAGITMFNRMIGDVSAEEEKAYRETVLPEWDRQRELVLFKGKDGRLYHKNVSYMIPHAQMAGVVTSALRGESMQQAVGNSVSTLFEDVGGELPFVMQSLVPAVGNYIPGKGEPISTDPSKLNRAVDQAQWFAQDAFMPGVVREMDKALKDQPLSQTALRQAGIRINDTTIEEGVGYKLRQAKDYLKAQRTKYNRDVFGGMTPQAAYDANNEGYRLNFENLITYASDLKTLGKTEDEIINIFKDNGLSGRDTLMAIDGKVSDLRVGKRDTPSARWEEMSDLNYREKLSTIRSTEDRSMRDTLMQKLKKEKEYQRRGLSERDQVILSLGVSDGERASYIYDRMKDSANPYAYLMDLRQKRIATKNVLRQIRIKQQADIN